MDLTGLSYRQFLAQLVEYDGDDIRQATAKFLGLGHDSFVLDNLEQVLAKTDLHIGARYAELAKHVPCSSEVFARIEAEFERTLRAVRDVTGESRLLARDPELREALDERAPYLDILSYLQVELLDRKLSGRGLDPASDDAIRVERAIHLTISGISAGLRNTG